LNKFFFGNEYEPGVRLTNNLWINGRITWENLPKSEWYLANTARAWLDENDVTRKKERK
jgi:3-oxoacyl-ACP reductase-like protein